MLLSYFVRIDSCNGVAIAVNTICLTAESMQKFQFYFDRVCMCRTKFGTDLRRFMSTNEVFVGSTELQTGPI